MRVARDRERRLAALSIGEEILQCPVAKLKAVLDGEPRHELEKLLFQIAGTGSLGSRCYLAQQRLRILDPIEYR